MATKLGRPAVEKCSCAVKARQETPPRGDWENGGARKARNTKRQTGYKGKVDQTRAGVTMKGAHTRVRNNGHKETSATRRDPLLPIGYRRKASTTLNTPAPNPPGGGQQKN